MSSTDLSRIDAAQVANAAPAASGAATRPGRCRSWITRRHDNAQEIAPGLVLAVFVAMVATPLGAAVPVVGAPVLGIVLGLVLAAVIRPAEHLRPGLGFASQPVLQAGIVVIGATLSLHQVAQVGLESLPVMPGTLAAALLGAWLIGRMLGIRGELRILIGVGTGICGASAIAATSAVIAPERRNVAYAIATIFTFNIAAVLLFPTLGHLWGLGPRSFGLWAGTAINDTSSVVAAAFAFSPAAGPYAVVVKLCRTLALIPIALTLGVWRAYRDRPASDGDPGAPVGMAPGVRRLRLRSLPWRKMVPLFLIGFVLTSCLATAGLVPAAWDPRIAQLSTFLITTALAGIGLSLRLSDLRRAGVRPLLLGAVLWLLVAATSLGLQSLTHTL